jgi:hypothetical protein
MAPAMLYMSPAAINLVFEGAMSRFVETDRG